MLDRRADKSIGNYGHRRRGGKFSGKVDRVKGIEPFAEKSESVDSQPSSQTDKTDYTQIRAHATGATCPNLAKVVAVWSKLPAPLKAAILAIVESWATSTEDAR